MEYCSLKTLKMRDDRKVSLAWLPADWLASGQGAGTLIYSAFMRLTKSERNAVCSEDLDGTSRMWPRSLSVNRKHQCLQISYQLSVTSALCFSCLRIQIESFSNYNGRQTFFEVLTCGRSRSTSCRTCDHKSLQL